MYEAVKAKKIPCALVVFEGEQHGFRKAENIQRALNSEVGREKELGNVAVKSADADTYMNTGGPVRCTFVVAMGGR